MVGAEAIAVIGGIVFLAIALFGGLKAEKVEIPRLPVWARIAAALSSTALFTLAFFMPSDDSESPPPTAHPSNAPSDKTSAPARNPSTPPTPEQSPPAGVEVTIKSPTENSEVQAEAHMWGTAHNVPAGYQIWIVNESSDGKFYPQDGPVALSANGDWKAPTLYVNTGGENDVGATFTYSVVVVPETIGKHFADLRKKFEGDSALQEDLVFDRVHVKRVD